MHPHHHRLVRTELVAFNERNVFCVVQSVAVSVDLKMTELGG